MYGSNIWATSALGLIDLDFADTTTLAVIIIGGLFVVLLFMLLWLVPMRLWLAARFARASVSIRELVGMRFRGVDPFEVVDPRISAVAANLDLPVHKMEALYLALKAKGLPLKGAVPRVVTAVISAFKAKIDLDFDLAVGIALAGRDILEAVEMSVKPKIITTPRVTAVAKDGIELTAVARITVRANIRQLVGGAGEETVIARVGESVVSTIGSSENYKQVLENPDLISAAVLEKGLDSETMYHIVSIDIQDVDVGRNIGANLQTDQAEADKKVYQAKAEARRAMAVAEEQEWVAKTQEMRAKVVEAEIQVPLAMSEALQSGNLGVMDYYGLKNIIADTDMRSGIAGLADPEESGDGEKPNKK